MGRNADRTLELFGCLFALAHLLEKHALDVQCLRIIRVHLESTL